MSDNLPAVSRVQMHETGPEFSKLVWGSMRMESQFDSDAEIANHLAWLADRGVTTIDTAAVYGDPHPFAVEEILGRGLKTVGRDKFEIVTKCGIRRISKHRPENRVRHFDFSAKEILESAEKSLIKLGIEQIDVLLLHRPDYLMEPAETAEALTHLVSQGKVKHIGVSNFSPSRMELLKSEFNLPIVTNQVQMSPIFLDHVSDGVLDYAMRTGHKPMIWSPVGGGNLLKAQDEWTIGIRKALQDVADKYGFDGPAEAAFAFVARHPAGGVPIIGTGSRSRIEGAIKATETEIDKQDWYQILTAHRDTLAF